MAHTRFGERTAARAHAMQLLFQSEACGRSVDSLLTNHDYVITEGPLSERAQELARGCEQRLSALDRVLDLKQHTWPVHRMPAVDRQILRLALYELLYDEQSDYALVANEATELARVFAGEQSRVFVNGIIGAVIDDLEAGQDVLARAHEHYLASLSQQDSEA